MVVLVVVVETLFPLPKQYNPMSIIALLAQKLDNKVRPDNSQQQQLISGTLSYIVVFIPLLVVLEIALSLAEFRYFFDACLLYIAVGFGTQKQIFIKIKKALAEEKKLLAKQWLASLVKRNVASLSTIGISKAAMESLLLRWVYQVLTPVFIFLVVGAVYALAYRIALECYWEWKRPFTPQAMFAKPMQLLCKLCQLLPLTVICLLSLVVLLPRKTQTQHREAVPVHSPNLSLITLPSLLFHIVGKRLGFALGGPIEYSGERQKLHRYGRPLQVRFSDMTALEMSILAMTLMMLLLCLLTGVLFYVNHS